MAAALQAATARHSTKDAARTGRLDWCMEKVCPQVRRGADHIGTAERLHQWPKSATMAIGAGQNLHRVLPGALGKTKLTRQGGVRGARGKGITR